MGLNLIRFPLFLWAWDQLEYVNFIYEDSSWKFGIIYGHLFSKLQVKLTDVHC